MSEQTGEKPAAIQAPPKFGAGSSREAWAAYACACGYDVFQVSAKGRDAIIELVETTEPPKLLGVPVADEPPDVAALIAQAREEGRKEGYAEGLAASKPKLPLFEGARQWAFKNAAKIARFGKFIDAHAAGLFDEITAEYPGEKLIRSDQELIFNAVKKHLRRQKALTTPGVEITAERKREMRRTVRDVEEVVVS